MVKQYIAAFISAVFFILFAAFPVSAGMISNVAVTYAENGVLVVDAGTIGQASDGHVMRYDISLIDKAYDIHSMSSGFISSGETLSKEIKMDGMPEGKYTAYVTVKYSDGTADNGSEIHIEDASSEEFSYPDMATKLKTGSLKNDLIKWMTILAAGICVALPIYFFVRTILQKISNR